MTWPIVAFSAIVALFVLGSGWLWARHIRGPQSHVNINVKGLPEREIKPAAKRKRSRPAHS